MEPAWLKGELCSFSEVVKHELVESYLKSTIKLSVRNALLFTLSINSHIASAPHLTSHLSHITQTTSLHINNLVSVAYTQQWRPI